MGLRYDEIGDILKLIDSSSCEEFVLETADIRLVLRRHGADGAASPAGPTGGAPALSAAPSAPASARPAPRAPASPATAHVAHVVRSPMVGTFYQSPSPGEPPFVEVGTRVEKGDPIGIIEVMKLFTTIHAEWSGTVTEIGIDDGQLAEYGQMLFVIAPG